MLSGSDGRPRSELHRQHLARLCVPASPPLQAPGSPAADADADTTRSDDAAATCPTVAPPQPGTVCSLQGAPEWKSWCGAASGGEMVNRDETAVSPTASEASDEWEAAPAVVHSHRWDSMTKRLGAANAAQRNDVTVYDLTNDDDDDDKDDDADGTAGMSSCGDHEAAAGSSSTAAAPTAPVHSSSIAGGCSSHCEEPAVVVEPGGDSGQGRGGFAQLTSGSSAAPASAAVVQRQGQRSRRLTKRALESQAQDAEWTELDNIREERRYVFRAPAAAGVSPPRPSDCQPTDAPATRERTVVHEAKAASGASGVEVVTGAETDEERHRRHHRHVQRHVQVLSFFYDRLYAQHGLQSPYSIQQIKDAYIIYARPRPSISSGQPALTEQDFHQFCGRLQGEHCSEHPLDMYERWRRQLVERQLRQRSRDSQHRLQLLQRPPPPPSPSPLRQQLQQRRPQATAATTERSQQLRRQQQQVQEGERVKAMQQQATPAAASASDTAPGPPSLATLRSHSDQRPKSWCTAARPTANPQAAVLSSGTIHHAVGDQSADIASTYHAVSVCIVESGHHKITLGQIHLQDFGADCALPDCLVVHNAQIFDQRQSAPALHTLHNWRLKEAAGNFKDGDWFPKFVAKCLKYARGVALLSPENTAGTAGCYYLTKTHMFYSSDPCFHQSWVHLPNMSPDSGHLAKALATILVGQEPAPEQYSSLTVSSTQSHRAATAIHTRLVPLPSTRAKIGQVEAVTRRLIRSQTQSVPLPSTGTRAQHKQSSEAQPRPSRFRGVHWSRKSCSWRAQIGRRTIILDEDLRRFCGDGAEEAAARAYDREARKLHGDEALLNFPAAAHRVDQHDDDEVTEPTDRELGTQRCPGDNQPVTAVADTRGQGFRIRITGGGISTKPRRQHRQQRAATGTAPPKPDLQSSRPRDEAQIEPASAEEGQAEAEAEEREKAKLKILAAHTQGIRAQPDNTVAACCGDIGTAQNAPIPVGTRFRFARCTGRGRGRGRGTGRAFGTGRGGAMSDRRRSPEGGEVLRLRPKSTAPPPRMADNAPTTAKRRRCHRSRSEAPDSSLLATNGCLIEASWLVHGGHGASLRQSARLVPTVPAAEREGQAAPRVVECVVESMLAQVSDYYSRRKARAVKAVKAARAAAAAGKSVRPISYKARCTGRGRGRRGRGEGRGTGATGTGRGTVAAVVASGWKLRCSKPAVAQVPPIPRTTSPSVAAAAATATERHEPASKAIGRELGFGIEIGRSVEVWDDRHGQWYKAKITGTKVDAPKHALKIAPARPAVWIHFVGWKGKYDRWVLLDSEHVRAPEDCEAEQSASAVSDKRQRSRQHGLSHGEQAARNSHKRQRLLAPDTAVAHETDESVGAGPQVAVPDLEPAHRGDKVEVKRQLSRTDGGSGWIVDIDDVNGLYRVKYNIGGSEKLTRDAFEIV
jgi:hypothetical protein